MRYLPKLQQLKVFQQVIRSGSIRGAARALNQSQPAVSRTLRELEQTLDTQLIVRGNQGMTLTETGRAFAQRMQFILEELERAADEIRQIEQYSQGSVAIGFSSLLALTVFPGLAGEFKTQFPQSKLLIKEGQLSTLLPALREGNWISRSVPPGRDFRWKIWYVNHCSAHLSALSPGVDIRWQAPQL